MTEARIALVDPTTFELEEYSTSDENLISSIEVSTLFNPSTDYIEYYIYNPNNGGLVFPPSEVSANYTNYTLEDNILSINPESDLKVSGYLEGTYNTFYNFLSTRLSSNFNQRYYISEISSDRTEIRLDSNTISTENIISSSLDFIQERNTDEYFPDFYLNFGSNQLVIANNILLDTDTVLIKLYEPLPPQYQLKDTLWVVEQVAEPIAYLVELINLPIIVDNSIRLKGPNLNIKVKEQVNNSTEATDLNALTETSITSSLQQVNSFYDDPSVQINVDYTNFLNFIKFSSAEKRLKNFFYKIQQIENWTTLAAEGSNISITNTSASTAFYQNKINETIDEFDNYEYFLYFTSGSNAYPKTNTDQPYNQASSTSTLAQTWITSSITTASLYDVNNKNWIYYSIPAYLREDSANQPYIDFSNMVGHFYDENIWVYIKDITNKWDNDNRIDSGISRDLIAQQLRDLGFNLYENQFSSFDIFTATLGLTPSGSYFPFPNMTGSLPTPSGFEYVNASITGSNEILPQDDIKKRIYKRIYNNLPYLYKKKGTVDGIRTLATIYGIPNTLLRIDEFGGKDKTNVNDWDYWFEQFNYKFESTGDAYIATTWSLDPGWGSSEDRPETVEFRFKSLPASPDTPTSQSLWSLNDGAFVKAVLEYDTSSLSSGSFSGSIPNPNYQSGSLRFTTDNFASSTVISLPFFNGDWWNVSITRDTAENFTLRAANSLYSGSNGSSLGWEASSSFTPNDLNKWNISTTSYFPSDQRNNIDDYVPFTGSYQEIRYYNTALNSGSFFDHTMNPQSFEGNSINSAPDELAFRATLGGELYTGSLSMHPKVSGSWVSQSSFTNSNSAFHLEGESVFSVNREYVFMDQPAVGIKNRITDKIRQVALNLPSGSQQLSNIRSIQQDTEIDDAYTDTVNQVEVVLSPTNQINDDIINSIGYLNIGEYIGDPRQNALGSTNYPDLDALRDEYFLKYTSNYDWNDFIRLIKFFDNSLWKTIKDFIPAKVSAATGISIKQHLLERQKYPEPSASYSEPYYTGSIGQIAGLKDGQRIYTASGDYDSFPIVTTTGSQGGTLPVFVEDTNYTEFTYPGAVNVTQSWNGSNVTPFGFEDFTQDDAREFIDGEFSGSDLVITNGEINPGCNDIKVADATTITFDIDHFTFNSNGIPDIPTSLQLPFGGPSPSFLAGVLSTPSGDLDFWWNSTRKFEALLTNDKYTDTFTPEYIAISKTSKNGVDLTNVIPNIKELTILTSALSPTVRSYTGYSSLTTSTSTIKLTILEIVEYNTSYLIRVNSNASITLVSLVPTFDPAPSPYPVVIPVQNNVLTVLDPYFDGNFANSNCNAILNNEIIARRSNIFWDLDYSTNAIQAVNQQVVITASQQDGDLPKAFIQDYNYYSTPILRRNYLGAKSTAPDFNEPSSAGGFGQLPVVQSEGYYFAYFNWVGGTSPEWGNGLEDRSAVNVRYYIGEEGNVIEPINDSDGINLSIVQQGFEQDSNAILSFNDKEGATSKFSNLEGKHKIFKSGQIPQPIIYSQTESIAAGETGGYAPSLIFVQGDQAQTSVDDYRLTSNANSGFLTANTTLAFPNTVVKGDEATFTTPYTTFSPSSNPQAQSPKVSLTFKVYLETSLVNNFSTATIQLKKGTSVVASKTFNFIDGNVTLTYSDSTVTASDSFTVFVDGVNQSPEDGPFPSINGNSYLKVTQSPPASTGVIASSNYWTIQNGNEIVPDNLAPVYGQKQEDISGSGFNPITLDFNLQLGDEFRFRGTETQTYTIISQSVASGTPIFHVDRDINLTSVQADWFLVRRYVNDPSYLILEVDKPAGGTSTGVITPEYFYGATEEKVDNILKELKKDNLI